MNGQDFMRIVQEAFLPFLKVLGFYMDTPSISGKFYRASFSSPNNVVSISYEPGDNVQFVMVFSRENGELSDIDDRSKTPRLADLNSHYMSKITNDERVQNEAAFASVHVNNKEESFLLKSAKELSLVLPKYIYQTKPQP
jgi:hypothetical protein